MNKTSQDTPRQHMAAQQQVLDAKSAHPLFPLLFLRLHIILNDKFDASFTSEHLFQVFFQVRRLGLV